MRRSVRQKSCALVSLAFVLWLAACGGGRSPTAPGAPVPQIGGSWTGSFSVLNFGLRSSMQLVQADDGTVQGLLLIFPNYINVAGTVSSTSFIFHSTGGCPAVAGTLALNASAGTVTGMSGPTSQDFAGCIPNAHPTEGTLDLTRQ